MRRVTGVRLRPQWVVIPALAGLIVVFGCGPDVVGTTCEDDADCESGLECVDDYYGEPTCRQPSAASTTTSTTVPVGPACAACEPVTGDPAVPVQCGSPRAMSANVQGRPRFELRSGDAVFHTPGTFPLSMQACRSHEDCQGCERVFNLSLNLGPGDLDTLAQGGEVALTCADGFTSVAYGEDPGGFFSATQCAITVRGVAGTSRLRGALTATVSDGVETLAVTGCFCSDDDSFNEPDPCTSAPCPP